MMITQLKGATTLFVFLAGVIAARAEAAVGSPMRA
jgi:hypothetical protein